jgi:hypothetical protein
MSLNSLLLPSLYFTTYRASHKLSCKIVSGQTVMKSVRRIEKLKIEKFHYPKNVVETL